MNRSAVLSLALVSLLASCAPPKQGDNHSNASGGLSQTEFKSETGKPGGFRSVHITSDPKTFNYGLASETTSTDLLDQAFVGLVRSNHVTTDMEPELAEALPEVSVDKLSYTVTLREGLKWSDGHPLTADDVLFTFNEVADNKKIPSNFRDGLLVDGQFPKVEKLSDRKIRFTTVKPFAPFLRQLELPILPAHVLQASVKKLDSKGDPEFNKLWGTNANVQEIIVNGPFKFDTYLPGQRVIMVKNDNYWQKDDKGQGLPYLDKMIFHIVKDYDAGVVKFKANETDGLEIRANEYEIFKEGEKAGNYGLQDGGPSWSQWFVMFNLTTAKDSNGKPYVNPVKQAWFQDVRFRKALAYAVDKQSIIKNVFRSLAVPETSWIAPASPYYNADVPKYDYDLAKAASLLEEAGFKKNNKGELYDAKGNRVEINYATQANSKNVEATNSILKADLEKLGIKFNVQPIQFNVLVQKIDETHDWEMLMIGFTASVEPHSSINMWRTDGALHMFNMGKGTTFAPWEKELENLMVKGSTSFDAAERKRIYAETQRIVADQVPALYLVHNREIAAIRNTLGNVFFTAYGRHNYNNAYEQFNK